ncbi:MAG: hypothetical protein M3Q26_11200 [Acidobacteriota bacterium]|nr:hypothetical protein [Acidobacteriota bacterium]
MLEVNGKNAWVLDAKGPGETITTGKNVQQAYFYAIHPEIRVDFYALCNGREFILFHIGQDAAVLHFSLSEIDKHWTEINRFLAPKAFEGGKPKIERSDSISEFDYLARKPLNEIKKVRKRKARRHFGVHGYFTKQSWDIVHAYILNFTKPDDVVLDPFGGSGVTVVEALMTGRKGIHVDLNPLSILLARGLIAPVNPTLFHEEFDKIKRQYLAKIPKTEAELANALAKYPHPSDYKLPKGSDVPSVEMLFNPQQTAHLALLKHFILKVTDKNIRDSFLLAFSSTITRTNLTYHWSSQGETGDASVFRYYRYRIAPDPAHYEVIDSFAIKIRNLIAAKKEMSVIIDSSVVEDAQIVRGTATDLEFIENDSVDYIYTDPPYGKKIQYLDLSVMWNAWLDLNVSEADYELEAIEGGEHNKTS